MDAMETGKRIQSLRKQKEWTQKDLAEKLCVSDKAVSKWERGLNYPDMAILEPLAKTLDTTVVELLGIENAPEAEKVEAVTAVALEETTRIHKETRDRALVCLLFSIIIYVSQMGVSIVLHDMRIYDSLPHALSQGMSTFTALLIGNSLWIWWKHRK